MAKQRRRSIGVRGLIILTCIVVFVLVNSIQESYVGIDNVPIGTIITTDTGSVPTDPQQTETTTPTEPLPTGNPPPPGNGIITGQEPFLSAKAVPIVIVVLIGCLMAFLLIRKRREVTKETITRQVSQSVVRSRRDKFKTEIRTLVDILKEYLEKGLYSEGIIFGFHQLDENMKRILGIKRDSHLTPKEFSNSLELPEIITHLNWLISSFYHARYKIDTMTYQDLEGFIENLESMKVLSTIKADIEIPETKLLEGEK